MNGAALPRPGPRRVPSSDCRLVSSGGDQLAVAFEVRSPERSIWPAAASSSNVTMCRYVATTARAAGTYVQIDYPWTRLHRHRAGDIARTSCPAWCPIADRGVVCLNARRGRSIDELGLVWQHLVRTETNISSRRPAWAHGERRRYISHDGGPVLALRARLDRTPSSLRSR